MRRLAGPTYISTFEVSCQGDATHTTEITQLGGLTLLERVVRSLHAAKQISDKDYDWVPWLQEMIRVEDDNDTDQSWEFLMTNTPISVCTMEHNDIGQA